jgi:ribosome biogenesis GTPase
MQGKIIKGIAGLYYVHVPDHGIYECKAKGAFRNQGKKPLVGDDVIIDILDDKTGTGNIIDILERKNELIRPAVANVDQAMIIFAAASPKPNFNLLDRFLIMMQRQDVPTIICFNKQDMVEDSEIEKLQNIYAACGYDLVFISVQTGDGFTQVVEMLSGKTTVLAGPSGVGKSSLMNRLHPDANMETGQISEKIQRGKHTTRHSELIHVDGNTYVMDTPGFSSLYVEDMEKEELKDYFPEFAAYQPYCKFLGCNHLNEPECGVKAAVESGEISSVRYQNYELLFEELKNKRKW